ncbi:MAG: hypothetical protein IPK13_15500 [Deltaproteobacteria bacterium]|nr:hypothetical protein [Deltaproteobacteria bacterium]
MFMVLGLLASVPAQKNKPSARDRPVEMTARGGLTVDLKRNLGLAKGDVVIRRDDVLVCCDEAEAKYAGDKVERITCRGRVVILRPDGTSASADVAIFEAVRDKLELKGRARVQGRGTDLSGDQIIYDVARDQLEVVGSRSRFKFVPGDMGPPAPLRPCPPPDPPRAEATSKPTAAQRPAPGSAPESKAK